MGSFSSPRCSEVYPAGHRTERVLATLSWGDRLLVLPPLLSHGHVKLGKPGQAQLPAGTRPQEAGLWLVLEGGAWEDEGPCSIGITALWALDSHMSPPKTHP